MLMLTPTELGIAGRTAGVAALAVLVALPLAVAVAWVLARTLWRGRFVLDVVVNLPLAVPPVVVGVALLALLGSNGPIATITGQSWAWSFAACVIASAVVAFPLMVRTARVALETVDPQLEDAARTLGAGRFDAAVTVTLPLAAPGIIAGGVLGFVRAASEFGATIVVAGNIPGLTRTLPLAIYDSFNQVDGGGTTWRLAAVSIVLAVVALSISEWLVRRGRARLG